MKQKNRLLWWLPAFLLLVSSVPAWAQMGIKIEMNHRAYMQYENIFARISLRNYSGHPLIFGASNQLNGMIRFEIVNPNGDIVAPSGKEMPAITGLLIEPGRTKELVIPVSRYYRLFDVGRYTIRAYISHPQLPSDFESKTEAFSVSSGMKVWEQQVGVPTLTEDGKPGDKILQRNYRIRSLYDGNRNYFYLVVDDDEQIYCIHRIGIEMSRAKPDCMVDQLSRLHILVQTNPRVFNYYVFNPDGTVDKEGVYRRTTSTPQLIRNDNTGMVIMAGGTEARENVDYHKIADQPFGAKTPDPTMEKARDRTAAPAKSFSGKLDRQAAPEATTAKSAANDGDKVLEKNYQALQKQPKISDPEIKPKPSVWRILDPFSSDKKGDPKKASVTKPAPAAASETSSATAKSPATKTVAAPVTKPAVAPAPAAPAEKKKTEDGSFWDFLSFSSKSKAAGTQASASQATTQAASTDRPVVKPVVPVTKPAAPAEKKKTEDGSFWDFLSLSSKSKASGTQASASQTTGKAASADQPAVKPAAPEQTKSVDKAVAPTTDGKKTAKEKSFWDWL
ncbi:MAG: hypothetical protein PHQ27_05345 [Victivallales bacterium]|nr:hypothetical protein [Victivallales bacterium]